MRFLFILFLMIMNSCNFISSKVDMKDYLFSSKERSWTLTNPAMPWGDMEIHHKPYKENGKDYVMVTTVQGTLRKVKHYEIRENSIELIPKGEDSWKNSPETLPRFISVDDKFNADLTYHRKLSETTIGDKKFEIESIEIGRPDDAFPSFNVYAKGIGLVVVSNRKQINALTGDKVPDAEMRMDVASAKWVNCKTDLCKTVD